MKEKEERAEHGLDRPDKFIYPDEEKKEKASTKSKKQKPMSLAVTG